MTRVRTIDGAIAQLKQDDPGTCLTRYALRQMILSGKVKYVRADAKYLVNYDDLLIVLSGETAPVVPVHGQIRRVM